MTRIAIAADLHVDPYFDRRDPDTGANLRELDMLRTVGWVARTARERGAEALVIAGDYTEAKKVTGDGKGPTTGRIAAIRDALLEGPARQIHVRGNHDWQWRGKSIVSVLAGIPGWSGYEAPGFELVGDVAVCCVPFLDRAWLRTQPGYDTIPEKDLYRALAEQYQVIAAGLYVQAIDAGASAAILVGHQQLPAELNDNRSSYLGDVDLVVDPRALGAIGYAAIVFGHVHRGQTVVHDPACPILFAGSVERVDWAEEGEEKSFVLLDVVDGRATVERIPTPAREFVTLDALAGGLNRPIRDAIVRVINLPPDEDPGELRMMLDVGGGAFAVTSIKRRPLEDVAVVGSMSESLTAEELLEQDLAGHPDREGLLALGREILAEAVA